MIPKELKEYLDSLNDEHFLAWLSIQFGTHIPKWEECSEEEYVKHNGTLFKDDKLTYDNLLKWVQNLASSEQYKVEPIYNDWHGGILNWIKLQEVGRMPDSYKFYKKVGEDFVIMIGGDLWEYCHTRECMKKYFEENKVRV